MARGYWLSLCPSTVVFITDVPDVADPSNYHGLYISHDGVTGPYQNYDAPMSSLPGTVAALGGGVGIVATWNDGTLRDGTGQPYMKATSAVTGTYPVQNDGVTPGQLASITITNGLITGVSVLP